MKKYRILSGLLAVLFAVTVLPAAAPARALGPSEVTVTVDGSSAQPLTGARRVGKTTIQYQIIDTLLKKQVPPQRIVFISMDHPMLKLSGLGEILECYHENIYAGQDCYYFFDEIQ